MTDDEKTALLGLIDDLADIMASMERTTGDTVRLKNALANLAGSVAEPPAQAPLLNLRLVSATDSTIEVAWDDIYPGATYAFSRTGVDATGYGDWESLPQADITGATFRSLKPDTTYPITVKSGLSSATGVFRTLPAPVADTPTTPPPATSTARNSGAYATGHSITELRKLQGDRGTPLGHVAVFPTRNQGLEAMGNAWWMPPKDLGTMISIAVPLCTEGGSLNQDISGPVSKIAAALKADGRPSIIRLGWEMNLNGWDHRLTEANFAQWVARYRQYSALFRTMMGGQSLIGLNPNVGGSQTGMRNDWFSRLYSACLPYVDWIGPDTYDCWPAMTSEVGVTEQWDREYGWKWWSAFAIKSAKPLVIPEWGVASGTQWAGNQGKDNPRFITEMRKFLDYHAYQGGTVLAEAYFHDSESYLKSDFTSNPKSGAEYNRLF